MNYRERVRQNQDKTRWVEHPQRSPWWAGLLVYVMMIGLLFGLAADQGTHLGRGLAAKTAVFWGALFLVAGFSLFNAGVKYAAHCHHTGKRSILLWGPPKR